MTRCLDIHTHHPAPQPYGVVSTSISDFNPIDGQLYSVGIHPWDTESQVTPEDWEKLETIAALPCVVAIGECGIDKFKGGLLYKQILIFKRQIELSEKLRKPLIIHDVKSHEVITGYRREMKPKQNWVIHGFRAKPTVAKMMTDLGIYLSYGETFNPESLKITPRHLLLAETDESPLGIMEIIAGLSVSIGEDITGLIAENTSKFLDQTPLIVIEEDEIIL